MAGGTRAKGLKNLRHCEAVFAGWGFRVIRLEHASRYGATDILGSDFYAETMFLQLWVQAKSGKHEGRRARTRDRLLAACPVYRLAVPVIVWPEGDTIDFLFPDPDRQRCDLLSRLRGAGDR